MLAPLSGIQRRRDFLVYDLEWIPATFPEPLNVRLCGVYDGDRYRYYRTVRAFIGGELTPANSGRWFYAHFSGGADFQFILNELVQFGSVFSLKGAFSGSSAIIVTVKRGKHHWVFVDSYWLLRDSLKRIGEWLGLEKGDGVDHDREWYATAPFQELLDYNVRDCEILYKAIAAFQEILLSLGGELKKTIAGCAMHLFRTKYLSDDLHTNKAVNVKARESYCASRVEVFATKCDDAYYYDVNSSFPFAMTFPMPGNQTRNLAHLPDRLLYDSDQTPFLCKARILVPECYLPPIPYRQNGRVFFPTGEWDGWFSGVDIDLLLKTCGTLVSVEQVVEFNPIYDLANYAQDIYARRKASEGFIKLAYKYLLNSLYGKFGESPHNKQTLYLNPSETVLDRLTGGDPSNRASMALPGLWIETHDRYIPHEHVPVATQITAIARRTLYRFLSQSEEIFYCDTDGFATTTEYEESEELGALKLEKKVVGGRFFAPKLYDLHTDAGKHIIKGKGFSLKNDPRRFEDVVQGHEIAIDRMRRIRENLMHGACVPREDIITKCFRNKLRPKRKPTKGGKTRPWTIKELNTVHT